MPTPVPRSIALLLALLSAGCGGSGAEAPAPQAVAIAEATALEVREARVTDLVAQLSLAIQTPVAVEAAAVPLAVCARITLVVPARSSREVLLTRTREVLRTAALGLEERDGSFLVVRVPGLEPMEACRGPGAEAAATEQLALDPLPEGIRLVSDNTYEVDPDAAVFSYPVESVVSLVQFFSRQGADGTPEGLAIYGIRRWSLASSLGFQNGDMIRSLDGRPVRTLDEALETFAWRSGAARFEVDVMRRGVPLTLTYIVVRPPN